MTDTLSNKVNLNLEEQGSTSYSYEEILPLKQRIEVLEQHANDLQARENRLQNELNDHRISLAEAKSRSQTFELLLNELRQADTRFRELFSLAPVAYASINGSGIIENINLAGTSILRYPSSSLLQSPFSDYLDSADIPVYTEHLRSVSSSSLSLKCKVTLKCADNTLRPVMLVTTAIRARQIGALSYQIMMIDITHQLETENRLHKAKDYLEKLAHHDALTHLPNRMKFTDDLHSSIAQAKSGNQKLALLYFDLDGFKPVNDTLGHQAGDKVLCEIADRLRSYVNNNVSVARLGGDEFTLILRGTADADEAVLFANALATQIKQPILVDDNEVHVSSSIGVSVFPDHARTANELIQGADAAMYRAKRIDRGCVNLCSRESTAIANRRSIIETTLAKAIQDEQFELYFQPIYTTKTLTINSVEALVRWHHPDLGMLSPAEFIPLAEKSQRIVELGKWIVNAACKQARSWHDEGIFTPIAINVSTSELMYADFYSVITEALTKNQLPSKSLEFEITESAIMSDKHVGTSTLQQMRDAGHIISIDDFGTGHSSLARLAQLPVSRLKIDKTFMDDLDNSAESRAIVRSIVVMAHELGLEVVSEGIEQSSQLEFLETIGCDAVQGFMMSRAKLPDAVTRLMRLDKQKISGLCRDLPQPLLERVSS